MFVDWKQMSEDDDGGEAMNSVYYSGLWTKQLKLRTAAKRVKHKRASKKTILLGNVPVGVVKDLRRLLNKRIHARHRPLGRRQFS